MLRGLYTSAIGMKQQMHRMDILANNLANVNTTGFKKDSVASRSFTEELAVRLHDPQPIMFRHDQNIGALTGGVFVDEVFTDFTSGAFNEVSEPYAAAISGQGFFTVSVTLPTGEVIERYTRDGSFTVNGQGVLVTKDGGIVQGQNGQINLPMGQGLPIIGNDGSIQMNGQVIDTLLMTDFANYETLRKVGDNYYETTATTQNAAFQGGIVQGYLESSNVNSVQEMVDMINVSRIFDANQRFVTTMDTVLNRAVNDLARKQ